MADTHGLPEHGAGPGGSAAQAVEVRSGLTLLADLAVTLARPELGLARMSRSPARVVLVEGSSYSFAVVNDADLSRALLASHGRYLAKGPFFAATRELLGDGMLTSEEPEHGRSLRLVAPYFAPSRMEGYVQGMSEVAERFVSAWLYEGGFDVHEQMRRLTLDVVVRCLLGGASSERSEGFLSAFAAGTDTLTARTLLSRVVRSSPSPQTHTAVGRFDRAATRAAGVAAEAWLRTRPAAPSGLASGIAGLPDRLARAGLNSASETDDLLSSLLAHAGRAHAGQDGGGLTWEEGVSAELLTLLLAGHETTASALTWALAHLARMGPAAQSRVADPGDRSLERLVHEVLRLYPPAWVIPRLVVERFAAGGAVFEPGTNLVFSPYLLHRNPQVFPDPGRFAPERWDDGLLDLPPSGFLPFGVGGRACIGRRFAQEEMRVILRAVLGRVRLEGGGRVPKPSFHFTLRPASSVRLRVRPA